MGLLYRATDLVEAVAEVIGAAAYQVRRDQTGAAEETRIKPRLLPGATEAPTR